MPIVINNAPVSNVIYKTQYTSVWVKAYYEDTWRYVPYLFPESSTEAAAPSDSEATLSWDYGKYINLWGNPGGTLLPINIENWHVRILVHTVYGTYIAWLGVVVGESMTETGIDVETGYPRGEQIIECRGLESLLERRMVVGTYVGNETEYVYLQRTRDFNVVGSRRENLAGNRSAFTNEVANCFLFSADGNKWSNYDIIKYLLAVFQPWMPFQDTTGQLYYAPQFRLVGQTSALRNIFEEHRFGGRTVRECLNSLIDRKRGLGWKIRTDGNGAIYVYVYSIAQYAITGNTASLPANTRQIDVPIHDDKFIKARYRISAMNQVDWIIVDSEEPVKTMATVRLSDGSLEPAWDPELDSEFLLNSYDTAKKALAENMLDNWDAVHTLTYFPNIQYSEFSAYSLVAPSFFNYILEGQTNPVDALLYGFNELDADGDGSLSKEDLTFFLPSDTYQTVSEDARATDKFAAVFSHFRVPKSWTWPNWLPTIQPNGQITGYGMGTYWNHDLTALRYLPIMEPGSSMDSEREYMEPFAVIAFPDSTRDAILALANANLAPYVNLAAAQAVYPSMTQSQFDDIGGGGGSAITWEDLSAAVLLHPYEWVQLDRTQQLDMPACSLRMGDAGLKVIVRSEYNHVFGKNHIDDADVEKDTVFDYNDLAVTIFFETDLMPRVAIPVWNNLSVNADGTITTQGVPVGKQIYIEVPGKEVWYAAPQTVRGLNEKALDFLNDGNPVVLRDDMPDLRFIAQLAYAWYGQQRASLDMTIQNQYPFFQIGDLIRTTISGHSIERIGTCVTAITRNYQDGTHNVSTGYGELDPTSFGEKFGGKYR